MDLSAIRTVQIHKFRCTKDEAVEELSKNLNLIANKYPAGLDTNTYFVVKGYEHVTKNQPIIRFSPSEGNWEITTINHFEINK